MDQKWVLAPADCAASEDIDKAMNPLVYTGVYNLMDTDDKAEVSSRAIHLGILAIRMHSPMGNIYFGCKRHRILYQITPVFHVNIKFRDD